MATGAVDRCPVCGEGSLRPRGNRIRKENLSLEGGPRPESDSREFECDICHSVVRGVGIHDYGKGVDSASIEP